MRCLNTVKPMVGGMRPVDAERIRAYCCNPRPTLGDWETVRTVVLNEEWTTVWQALTRVAKDYRNPHTIPDGFSVARAVKAVLS